MISIFEMDSLTIGRVLRSDGKTRKIFQGVFARDSIPLTLQPLSLYVLNLDLQRNPGTHWVLINTLNCPGQVEYFCSFGVKPKYARILDALSNCSRKAIFNDKQVQDNWSIMCGQHVLTTALLLSRGYSLYEILSDFYTDDLYKNDENVQFLISQQLRLSNRRRKQ